MTDLLVWFIVTVFIFIILFFLITFTDNRKENIKTGIGVTSLFILGMLYGAYPSEKSTYKDGQIDALKGKFEYRIEVKGILKDSTFIPTDTTFIKIK